MQNATFGDVPSTFGYSSNNEGVLSKATAGAHDAVNSVADAADGAARRVKPAIDQVAAVAHEVVENTAASAAPATNWISEQVSGLKASEKKLVVGTSAYIATNPLKSVGLAVLAGFWISRLVQR